MAIRKGSSGLSVLRLRFGSFVSSPECVICNPDRGDGNIETINTAAAPIMNTKNIKH